MPEAPGHGSTFQDNNKNYWHVSTVTLGVKNNFERRLGIWPAGFDGDDVMWCNTAFGDYPRSLPNPSEGGALHSENATDSTISWGSSSPLGVRGGVRGFRGWMLLNYKKSITVSSTYGSFSANNADDENMKTYWSAASANSNEWIQSDLGNVSTVNAVQINYADQDVDDNRLGKWSNQYHQYKLLYSVDGKKWNMLVDKSKNKTDVPHDYVELEKPVQAKFIRLENVHMPTGKFAISGLRVFGNGNGSKPDSVKTFIVLRTEKDKRSAWLKWSPVGNAFAYNIYFGTARDKLYNCIMVHDANEYYYKGMDLKKTYYYAIEAINENGVSRRSNVIKSE